MELVYPATATNEIKSCLDLCIQVAKIADEKAVNLQLDIPRIRSYVRHLVFPEVTNIKYLVCHAHFATMASSCKNSHTLCTTCFKNTFKLESFNKSGSILPLWCIHSVTCGVVTFSQNYPLTDDQQMLLLAIKVEKLVSSLKNWNEKFYADELPEKMDQLQAKMESLRAKIETQQVIASTACRILL